MKIEKVSAMKGYGTGAASRKGRSPQRKPIMRLEKAQYNPSLKLAIDISRVVEVPIEEIFIFE